MAQKDWQAAGQTIQGAIEARRLALGPSHPAVAESMLRLADISQASGQSPDAIQLLQKELYYLAEEGQASSAGRC